MNAWLDSARRLLGRVFEPRSSDVVTLHDDRFEVRHGERSRFEVAWDRVERVVAFKLDCYVHDLVCLGFVLTNLPDRMYVVDEEAVGYTELMAELARRYPSIDPDWYHKVAQPPFARNEKVLWERSPQEASS